MEKVQFQLGFSVQLVSFFAIYYLGVIAIFFGLSLPYFIKFIAITLIIFSFYAIWNLHLKRSSKKSVIRIWQNSDGRWGIETKEGRTAYASLLKDSYRSTWILILRFKLRSRTLSVLVPRDAISADAYRILSMRLGSGTPDCP